MPSIEHGSIYSEFRRIGRAGLSQTQNLATKGLINGRAHATSGALRFVNSALCQTGCLDSKACLLIITFWWRIRAALLQIGDLLLQVLQTRFSERLASGPPP